MANSGDDTLLPTGWIRKASRRCPTASYYFNTETGKSTWIHPNLLEWANEGAPKKKKKKGKTQTKAFQVKDEVAEKKPVHSKKHTVTNDSTTSPKKKLNNSDESKSKSEEPKPIVGKRKPVTFNITAKAKLKSFMSEQHKPSTSKAVKDVHTDGDNNKCGKSKLKPVSPGLSLIFDGYGDEDNDSEEKDAAKEETRKIIKAKRKGTTKKGGSKDILEDIVKEMNNNPSQEKKYYSLPIPFREERLKEKEKVMTLYEKKPKSVFTKNVPNRESVSGLQEELKSTEDSPSVTASDSTESGLEKTTVSPSVSSESKLEESKEVKNVFTFYALDVDDVTDMEVDEQEIIAEIATFRGEASHSTLPNDYNCSLHSSSVNKGSLEALFFVVDTNVLIHDTGISFLEALITSRIDGKETRIVIPYTALQEMDGLKRKETVGRACQSAIKWCHHHFETGDPRVQGQSYQNYLSTRAIDQQASGDDLIRDCCLQLQKEGLNVCLLSNDVNLCNKAFMANINATGTRKLQSKMNNKATRNITLSSPCKRLQMDDDDDYHMKKVKNETNPLPHHHQNNHRETLPKYSSHEDGIIKADQNVSQLHHGKITPVPKRVRRKEIYLNSEEEKTLDNIIGSLQITLSSILETVMKDIFGDLWLKIVLHKPPWTIRTLFICWDKHWIAVMLDIFPREVKNLVEEIKHMLRNCEIGIESVSTLTQKVKQLYRFFDIRFHDHIMPLPGESDGILDRETLASTTPSLSNIPPSSVLSPANTSLEENNSRGESEGVNNVKNMINQVGLHITHYVALVLDAYCVQHNLQTLNTTSQMNQEQAYSSGVNLHQVIYSLGTTIVRCMNEKNAEAILEVCHLLVNFWTEAKEQCPELPFTNHDLSRLLECQEGQQYLRSVIKELEKLMEHLNVIDPGANNS
ncbi:hypothetical protein Pcinc_025446 [Petrolisthes cinctipes]|uniref:WW domain-containing protein n=1 Tax=Petrolisthes cinctipes TaxID=88211 RepID=A0AAE1F7Y0_PETCI|nr:hypothetical protein Pcinc_025446 [Petrolisthes cinctipes]